MHAAGSAQSGQIATQRGYVRGDIQQFHRTNLHESYGTSNKPPPPLPPPPKITLLINPLQVVSIVVIVGCFAVNNLTFGLWRAKTHHYNPPHPPTQYMHPPPPPATPSQWQAQHENGGFFTPQHRLDWQMPGMVGHGGFQVEGGSPSKKIEYRR